MKKTQIPSVFTKNIYKTGELEEYSTTEEYSVVQKEGTRNVKRKIKFIRGYRKLRQHLLR